MFRRAVLCVYLISFCIPKSESLPPAPPCPRPPGPPLPPPPVPPPPKPPTPVVVHDREAHIFLGPPKTGTTHLWKCLTTAFRHYEDIDWGVKEKWLFGKNAFGRHTSLDYQQHLASGSLFDFTPNYLLMPDARDELLRVAPDARLGLVHRDPLSRAYSNWKMFKTWGWIKNNKTFPTVIAEQRDYLCLCEPLLCTGRAYDLLRIRDRRGVLERCFVPRWWGYLHYSLPALALLYWLEAFPPEQVTVLRFASLQHMDAPQLVQFLSDFTGLNTTEERYIDSDACSPSTHHQSYSRSPEGGALARPAADLAAMDATDFVLSLFPEITVV